MGPLMDLVCLVFLAIVFDKNCNQDKKEENNIIILKKSKVNF
jgi:hypothetical protein